MFKNRKEINIYDILSNKDIYRNIEKFESDLGEILQSRLGNKGYMVLILKKLKNIIM